MRQVFEDIGVMIVGAVIVGGMMLLYWGCRLFGIHLEEDF